MSVPFPLTPLHNPNPQFLSLFSAPLLAAIVVLEIEGNMSNIQSHFHTSSTSRSTSVGWGPFCVTSSFSHTDTQPDSTCEATAAGCKIAIKSLQTIGWVSQMVPALRRLSPTTV